MENELRTAVLLYGFLRTADITHKSLIDNVVTPNNADVFYFGPDSTDSPTSIHKGILDGTGFLKINPKNDALETSGGIEEKLKSYYGNLLKRYQLHTKTFNDFNTESAFIDRNQWLFSLNPARFFSMFYNMQKAVELMQGYENEMGFRYDRVVITRPDLTFYAAMDLRKIRDGMVYIPSGEGFCPHTGNRNYGLSQAQAYRNVQKGTMVPTGVGFNDQVLVFARESASHMADIYTSLKGYVTDKVPLTPETLLYYHLCRINSLKVKYVDDWPYEIVRTGDAPIVNVTDLMILDVIDRYHPFVKERVKKHRVKYFFKFGRMKYRAIKRRYFN